MWHVIERYNRVTAEKVSKERAEYLLEAKGGEVTHTHTPRAYHSNQEFEGNIFGYISSERPIYSYALYKVVGDGKELCAVTRKEDAFRIMHALKRDYKDIIVCMD